MPLFGASGCRNPQQSQRVPQNRRVQAFSFKEISGSPDLDHRADRKGRVKKRQLFSLPLHFCQGPLGDSFLKLLDSFWQPIQLSLGFFFFFECVKWP